MHLGKRREIIWSKQGPEIEAEKYIGMPLSPDASYERNVVSHRTTGFGDPSIPLPLFAVAEVPKSLIVCFKIRTVY
jgi:hypothetical protein